MIFVALRHALRAVQKRARPARIIRQRAACAVRADVRLVENVKPVSVAKVIPARVVGIMAGAHGVDVRLLHQGDVLNHPLGRKRVAGVGINLMPVHAAQPDRLAVDEKNSVADFNFPKTNLATVGFNHVSGLVVQREDERVKIGGFRRPLRGIFDAGFEPGELGFAALWHPVVQNLRAEIGIQNFRRVVGDDSSGTGVPPVSF